MIEADGGAQDGAFALVDGERGWTCTTAITFANARAALEQARTLPLPTSGVIDCTALHPVDSAAVAVLLAVKRRALEQEKPLSFINITPSLHTLADLYGVEELLVG